MHAQAQLNFAQFAATAPLPSDFLDPIGRMFCPSLNVSARHKDQDYVTQVRTYTETSGSLGTNPFTTVNGSALVSVNLTGHGFTEDSEFNTTGATAFNGITVAGTFNIVAITDANNFVIDTTVLGTLPNAGGSGGGASVTYVCDVLTQAIPDYFAIWNEKIHFDAALPQAANYVLNYFKLPPLLSATNQSNFLTNRYPKLVRVACSAAAADFMKDDDEFQKQEQMLLALIDRVSVENDLYMRGIEVETETP